MKQFYNRILTVTMLIILTSSITLAQEVQMKKYCVPENSINAKVNDAKIDFNRIDNKNRLPHTQAIDFYIIDSLANLYSYLYTMTNRSYIYDRTTDNYITIKRGAFPQTAAGTNKTYNLFLRISEDKGQSWQDPILVYDRDAIGYYEARFPSLYGFSKDGEQNVALSFPVIDYNVSSGTGDWYGFVCAMWTPDITDPAQIPMNAVLDLTDGGFLYKWSTDSRVLAGTQFDDPSKYFYVAASELTPDDDANLTNASALGLRYSEKVDDEIVSTIPGAWSGTKYTAPTTAGGRYNQIIDLRQANDGVMYLGVYGSFYNPDPGATNPTKVGASRSTDYGITWEEFNLLPDEKITEYVDLQGYTGGNLIIGRFVRFEPAVTFYSSKAFVALDNNEYSFLTTAFLYDASDALVEIQIIEIYYTSGAWGIRKVGTTRNNLFTYGDMLHVTGDPTTRLHGSDWELQLATTKDGQNLLAKWMSYNDIDATTTTDIYVATRNKNSGSWGTPQNITNDLNVDRIVLIPDYVPNDMSQIPILKLVGKGASQDSSTIPQYLAVGFFDAVVSVDDYANYSSNLTLEVMPNPVTDFARVKVYFDGKPIETEIAVYDVLGNKLSVVYSGELGYGTNYFDIKTNGLNSGVYYCTISLGDRKVTKMLNVLK